MKFDPFYHPKLYVIECVTPQHYYVGSTAQELYDRVDEHESGDPRVCCKWVHRHGFKRLVCWDTCTSVDCERLEDELTSYLMTWFGVNNVRGGNQQLPAGRLHERLGLLAAQALTPGIRTCAAWTHHVPFPAEAPTTRRSL